MLTKNLQSKRPSKKLDHVKVGPFLVDKQTRLSEGQQRVSYRLKLPPDAKVHPVFHVSLLEPADPATPLQTTFYFEADEGQEYEVERIVGMKNDRFEVKWKGYPESENTLEPLGNLIRCEGKLREYLQDNWLYTRPKEVLKRLRQLQGRREVRPDDGL